MPTTVNINGTDYNILTAEDLATLVPKSEAPNRPYDYVLNTGLVSGNESGDLIPRLSQANEWTQPQYYSSSHGQVLPTVATLTGSGLTPGDVVGFRMTFGGNSYDFTRTIVGGDTFESVNTILKNQVMANAAVVVAGIRVGFQTINPSPILYFVALWNSIPTVTDLTVSATAHYAITPSSGMLDSGVRDTKQHSVPGRLSVSGDPIYSEDFIGDTNNGSTPVPLSHAYAQRLVGIIDPSAGNPKGFVRYTLGSSYFQITPDGVFWNGVPMAGGEPDVYGDWTPVLRGSSTAGTASYVARQGKYIKRKMIGSNPVRYEVTLQGFILGTLSGASGSVQIAGLPCVIRDIVPSANLGFLSNINLSAGCTQIAVAGSNVNLSTLDLTQSGSGLGASAVPVGNLGANFGVRFTMSYITD